MVFKFSFIEYNVSKIFDCMREIFAIKALREELRIFKSLSFSLKFLWITPQNIRGKRVFQPSWPRCGIVMSYLSCLCAMAVGRICHYNR